MWSGVILCSRSSSSASVVWSNREWVIVLKIGVFEVDDVRIAVEDGE